MPVEVFFRDNRDRPSLDPHPSGFAERTPRLTSFDLPKGKPDEARHGEVKLNRCRARRPQEVSRTALIRLTETTVLVGEVPWHTAHLRLARSVIRSTGATKRGR